MADEKKPEAGLDATSTQVLLESIHKIAQGMDNGPIKQIPIAKYKARTPWHQSGDKRRPKLRRSVYMSGSRLREVLLSNEEIELLNQLKAGKYNGRRWVVVETDGETANGAITILVPNKTAEDRVRLKGEAPNLVALLRRMIAEHAEQNAPRK